MLQIFISPVEFQLMGQDPFDLSVDASKIIRRPFFKGIVDIFVNPEDKLLFHILGLNQKVDGRCRVKLGSLLIIDTMNRY